MTDFSKRAKPLGLLSDFLKALRRSKHFGAFVNSIANLDVLYEVAKLDRYRILEGCTDRERASLLSSLRRKQSSAANAEQSLAGRTMKIVRAVNLIFHYFFVARIVIALFAWLFGFGSEPGRWWMGPGYWMFMFWAYIYAPVCLFFFAFNFAWLFDKQYRQRLNTINWVLFFVALGVEMLYVRAAVAQNARDAEAAAEAKAAFGFDRSVFDEDAFPRPCNLSSSRYLHLTAGDTLRLQIGLAELTDSMITECQPGDPAAAGWTLAWTSGDSVVIGVDTQGVIEAREPGRSYVEAQMERQGRRGRAARHELGVSVTVLPRADYFALEPARTRTAVGDTAAFRLVGYDSLGAIDLGLPFELSYAFPEVVAVGEVESGGQGVVAGRPGEYVIGVRHITDVRVYPALLIVEADSARMGAAR